jgi:stringent starvation protein B
MREKSKIFLPLRSMTMRKEGMSHEIENSCSLNQRLSPMGLRVREAGGGMVVTESGMERDVETDEDEDGEDKDAEDDVAADTDEEETDDKDDKDEADTGKLGAAETETGAADDENMESAEGPK